MDFQIEFDHPAIDGDDQRLVFDFFQLKALSKRFLALVLSVSCVTSSTCNRKTYV